MNIIHYIFGMPPLRKGGLPKYALSLIECQKQLGHHIKIVVPGRFDKSNQTKIKKWKIFQGVPGYQIVNALPVSNVYGIKKIEEFIRPVPISAFEAWFEKEQIDLIHVHSIMGLPLEFLQAARKKSIKIVMTTHDYFGLCPKIDLMKGNKICNECDWSECEACCRNAYDVKRLKFEHSALYWWYCNQEWLFQFVHSSIATEIKKRIRRNTVRTHVESIIKNTEEIDYESLRQYYRNIFSCVDFFHFNSKQTEAVYRKYLGEISGRTLEITNDDVHDNRTVREYSRTLQLGYLGGKSQYKGFDFLMDKLQQVYDEGRKDFVCHIFTVENAGEYPFVVNHGPYRYGEQKRVFDLMDVLVVPSMWRETYGMVVLEAISYGVPVLVSEYVGAKTLVEKFSRIGKIFSVKGEGFLDVFKEVYDNRGALEEMNREILKIDFAFDMESHAKEIEELYKAVMIPC